MRLEPSVISEEEIISGELHLQNNLGLFPHNCNFNNYFMLPKFF